MQFCWLKNRLKTYSIFSSRKGHRLRSLINFIQDKKTLRQRKCKTSIFLIPSFQSNAQREKSKPLFKPTFWICWFIS